MDFSKSIFKLVNEMGFSRMEAQMALEESQGNIDVAIKKLSSGAYAPPPYAPTNQSISASGPYPRIEKKNQENKPTAPSFSSLSRDLNQIQIELPEGTKQMPPPYEIIDKSQKVKAWEQEANVFHFDSPTPSSAAHQNQPIYLQQGDRCDVCFNILENPGETLTQNKKIFHDKCFRKKFGPKCAYCCFPLSLPDKDHDLSGKYLVYKNKDYHVECYEKYAGPRCTHCFNVIIERPNGEFSGSWIVDGNHEYHTECYQKKLQSNWRVQNT